MIPSYANPFREVWDAPGTAGILQFGAAGETVAFKHRGPKGLKGLVRDIQIVITENMVGTTTVPEINVGAAASTVGSLSTTYARFRLGSAAGTGYTTSSGESGLLRARSLVTGNGAAQTLSDFTGHVALETALIAADTIFYISFVEGVDGSETGAGYVKVYIDWF